MNDETQSMIEHFCGNGKFLPDSFFSYGIGLDSETSVKGYFTCKTTGTYVSE